MGKFPNQIIWLVISQKICRETLHFFIALAFTNIYLKKYNNLKWLVESNISLK